MLADRMIRVVEDFREWIGEYGGCLLERDTMLAKVLACLAWTPGKPHAQSLRQAAEKTGTKKFQSTCCGSRIPAGDAPWRRMQRCCRTPSETRRAGRELLRINL